MRRRVLFITFFVLVGGGVLWYAATFVRVPELTFAEAAKIGDSKKKVIVSGKVLAKEVVPEGNALTFYMADSTGSESKVFYDGQDRVAPDDLRRASTAGRKVSISGHHCGDRFHTSGITIH